MYVLFCSGMSCRTMNYCGRWNTIVMAMTGDKAMMLKVLRCSTEFAEGCSRCYATLCLGVAVVIFLVYDIWPSAFSCPPQRQPSYDYQLGIYLLDLYHARFSQNLPVGRALTLCRQKASRGGTMANRLEGWSILCLVLGC